MIARRRVASLLIFAGVALVQGLQRRRPGRIGASRASWLSPFAVSDFSALVVGAPDRRLHLLGLGERRQPDGGDDATRRGARARGDRLARSILLVTYVVVSTAVVAVRGARDARRVRRRRGHLQRARRRRARLAAGTSSSCSRSSRPPIASTQTTIIPASRTTLSMGRPGRVPDALRARSTRASGRRRSRRSWIAVLAIVWYVPGALRLGELPLRHAVGALA